MVVFIMRYNTKIVKDGHSKNITFAMSDWEKKNIDELIRQKHTQNRSVCIREAIKFYLDRNKRYLSEDHPYRKNLEVCTVHLPMDMYNDLKKMTHRVSRSRSELIRFAIDNFLFAFHTSLDQENRKE